MKNLLYIDREFEDGVGGDKNRSRYLYRTLQKNLNVYKCIIIDSTDSQDARGDFELSVSKKKNILLPQAIAEFSKESLEQFVDFIKEHKIEELFFRTIAFSSLAIFAKVAIPSLNIIIDSDLILSRLMKQAWEKNRSFKSRYYFIEALKLSFYEKNLYKNDFTFLFSNEDECFQVKDSYAIKKAKYLQNTTDIEPKEPSCSQNNIVLFYGAMDSTANMDGYRYIEEKLYEHIKDALELYDYEIHIVGKGCQTLSPSKHKRIKIIGKVDSIEDTILNSAFVVLPIFVASGTNTRVMECAMAGRALVTTPLAMEGLLSDKNQKYITMNLEDMSSKIKYLMESKENCLEFAKSLQEEILSPFSYENFEISLKNILNESSKQQVSIIHIPRRFTQNSWGGTETVVINSAKNLEPLGYESTIYTSKALDKNKRDKIDSVLVKRFDYFYPYFGLSKKQKSDFDAIGGNLFSFSLLYALLCNKNIDLVHLHTLKRMGAIARSVAKYKKIPYVITLHGGYFNISQSEVNHRKEQLKNGYEWGKVLGWAFGSRNVMDDAAAIITLSKEEYKKAYIRYGEKVHYLSNGVDIEKFSNENTPSFKKQYKIASSKKMILCSARIDTQKNQLLLLEAIKELSKKYNDLHLVFLGVVSDDEYFSLLKTFIEKHSLSSMVTFVQDLTPKDQLLVSAYREAEMLVLPSRHEPFGMVILEAWAAGIPVVASLTGGIGKIITHERNGLVFENGNMYDLYKNMDTLLKDNSLRDEIIRYSREDVKEYDWRYIAKSLDAIYKGVLLEKGV